MAEIPAPLASRHTATGVVIVSLLGVVAAVATLVIPIDESSALGLVVARQLVLALQAAVLALAVGIVWRTLAKRSPAVTLAALAAFGGLLLLALAQVAWIVVPTAWGIPVVRVIVDIGFLLAAGFVVLGFLGLGIAVLGVGLWRGPTRATLLVAAPVAACVVVLTVLAPTAATIGYAVLSLVLLGLAAGLRAPRALANAGFPGSLAA